MIRTTGIYETKTNFNRIIAEVEAGKEHIVTRHGVPIARIVPITNGRSKDISKLIEDMRKLRESLPRGGPSIRELIDEGRKY